MAVRALGHELGGAAVALEQGTTVLLRGKVAWNNAWARRGRATARALAKQHGGTRALGGMAVRQRGRRPWRSCDGYGGVARALLGDVGAGKVSTGGSGCGII